MLNLFSALPGEDPADALEQAACVLEFLGDSGYALLRLSEHDGLSRDGAYGLSLICSALSQALRELGGTPGVRGLLGTGRKYQESGRQARI